MIVVRGEGRAAREIFRSGWLRGAAARGRGERRKNGCGHRLNLNGEVIAALPKTKPFIV
jgi:hypothetical protein